MTSFVQKQHLKPVFWDGVINLLLRHVLKFRQFQKIVHACNSFRFTKRFIGV